MTKETDFDTESVWAFQKGGLFRGMAGKPLYSVTLSDDQETVTFTFQDGTTARFQAEGDCCSHSWIEHLELPNDVKGQKLVGVTNELMGEIPAEDVECRQCYQTRFRTNKGETITIEYRNDSNGYYGGYLVRV